MSHAPIKHDSSALIFISVEDWLRAGGRRSRVVSDLHESMWVYGSTPLAILSGGKLGPKKVGAYHPLKNSALCCATGRFACSGENENVLRCATLIGLNQGTRYGG
jgi:hypothetical protein